MKLVLLLACLVLAACITPEATQLPDDDPGIVEEPGPELANREPSQPDAAEAGNAEPVDPPVQKLEYKNVRGGRITYEVDGTVGQVRDMLLDLDGTAEHRAWCEGTKIVERSGPDTTALWNFEGKAGVNPEAKVVHRLATRDDGTVVIRYRLAEPVFGLAAFFGDYRVSSVAPERSRIVQRVYIESGLLINASDEDIRDGLQEDARRITKWMRLRTKPAGDPTP